MTHQEEFTALLDKLGVTYTVTLDDDCFTTVEPEHNGLVHCYWAAKFTPNGTFIEFEAGY
jgi:hypothetical protein